MFKCLNDENKGSKRIITLRDVTVLGFVIGIYVIRICFVFRASDFGFK